MTQQHSQSIAQLYAAFSHVPRPQHIAACPCCVADDEIAVLLATPVCDLSPEQLSSYASSVTRTAGSADDLRYFIPRVLEIVAADACWWPEVEVVFGALDRARWQMWQQNEATAIIRFAHDVFADLLTQPTPNGDVIDAWLCAFGRGKLDLDPFLRQLQAPAARHKLAEYHEANRETLIKNKLANSFWDDAPEAVRQVVAWFRSPAVEQALREGHGMQP